MVSNPALGWPASGQTRPKQPTFAAAPGSLGCFDRMWPPKVDRNDCWRGPPHGDPSSLGAHPTDTASSPSDRVARLADSCGPSGAARIDSLARRPHIGPGPRRIWRARCRLDRPEIGAPETRGAASAHSSATRCRPKLPPASTEPSPSELDRVRHGVGQICRNCRRPDCRRIQGGFDGG